MLPHANHAFFGINLRDIAILRNIRCRLDENGMSDSGFQLCAIRLYHGKDDANTSTYFVYDGLRYVNIFHRYIQKYCPLWPRKDSAILDIGSATCQSNPTFERFEESQLCICGTDNCNQNWSSCYDSIEQSSDILSLTNFIPDLSSTMQCNATVNASNVCRQHHFIDTFDCEAYVNYNSVLCAITVNGTTMIQTPLIEENYEAYLETKIYQIRSAGINNQNFVFSESDTNVYYNYSTSDIDFINECVCTSSFCNQDVITCSSTTAFSNPTTASSASTTPVTTSNTSANTTITSGVSTSSTASSGTSATTATASQASTMTTSAQLASVTPSVTNRRK